MSSPRSTASSTLTPTALVVTSQLLRHDNPSLASAIQAALDDLAPVASREEFARMAESELNVTLLHALQARTVGQILAALTVLGKQALAERDLHPQRVELLHQLLDDWVALADWILQRSEFSQTSWH